MCRVERVDHIATKAAHGHGHLIGLYEVNALKPDPHLCRNKAYYAGRRSVNYTVLVTRPRLTRTSVSLHPIIN